MALNTNIKENTFLPELNEFKNIPNIPHSVDIINSTDLIRVAANAVLDKKKKSALGQFFTPSPIGMFMASLFDNIEGRIRLLDPGCGSGSLTACFVAEAIARKATISIEADTFDIETAIKPYLQETMEMLESECSKYSLEFSYDHSALDFILMASDALSSDYLNQETEKYTHVIMNPPYKKISTSSPHRKALCAAGIETVNLYAGFVALAVKMLKPSGEIVAIIPRSFCNGPYYDSFRKFLIKNTSFHHIHVFDSRNKAFGDDNVLQENIIIHCKKNGIQESVKVTSSHSADFYSDALTDDVTASNMTSRVVKFDSIVKPSDQRNFIHIAPSYEDQQVVDQLSTFNNRLDDVGVKVSTGPVVDFRVKEDLRSSYESGSVPLLYPVHLNGSVDWPKKSKKPNAIHISDLSMPWLWKNSGYFVVVRRFSSKEEKKRIVATVYDGSLPEELIGFENKLNVFHADKTGFDENLAKGIYIYLNSSLVDRYYRTFGGHTQVNATDLKSLNYPSAETLRRMGKNMEHNFMQQSEIDELLMREIGL